MGLWLVNHTSIYKNSELKVFEKKKSFIFLKTCNSQFLYIEVWFTDQSSKFLLDIEDKINITLVID